MCIYSINTFNAKYLKDEKTFFILLLFIAGETLFAQEGVVFEHGTLNEALAKAKKIKRGQN